MAFDRAGAVPIRPWETPPPSTLAARPARPLSTATTALLLLAITAVGAALRFVRLDVPTLWGDEVATFGRVIGTFDELMKRLVNEGFVPLHYVAYWALGKLLPLTPANMRLIPAVTGTLMIPAAFFLARQMTTRRVALLAALLVSVSAYGLIYSRDAKMYMPNWLFVTLATGCLLHHLRSKAWWSWGGWALAGALGAATHATALLMLAVWPLMLLTHEGRRRRAHRRLPRVVLPRLQPLHRAHRHRPRRHRRRRGHRPRIRQVEAQRTGVDRPVQQGPDRLATHPQLRDQLPSRRTVAPRGDGPRRLRPQLDAHVVRPGRVGGDDGDRGLPAAGRAAVATRTNSAPRPPGEGGRVRAAG